MKDTDMTHTIATLHPTETVQFDHAILAALCAAEGDHAEETITRILTDVEELIALVAVQGNNLGGLARTCAELSRLSGQIGMTTIRAGADAVLTCIAQDNRTSLAACTARLLRLGEPRQKGGWAMAPARDTGA